MGKKPEIWVEPCFNCHTDDELMRMNPDELRAHLQELGAPTPDKPPGVWPYELGLFRDYHELMPKFNEAMYIRFLLGEVELAR